MLKFVPLPGNPAVVLVDIFRSHAVEQPRRREEPRHLEGPLEVAVGTVVLLKSVETGDLALGVVEGMDVMIGGSKAEEASLAKARAAGGPTFQETYLAVEKREEREAREEREVAVRQLGAVEVRVWRRLLEEAHAADATARLQHPYFDVEVASDRGTWLERFMDEQAVTTFYRGVQAGAALAAGRYDVRRVDHQEAMSPREAAAASGGT